MSDVFPEPASPNKTTTSPFFTENQKITQEIVKDIEQNKIPVAVNKLRQQAENSGEIPSTKKISRQLLLANEHPDKKLKVGFKVDNILNSQRQEVYRSFGATDQTFELLQPRTRVSLSLGYKFIK